MSNVRQLKKERKVNPVGVPDDDARIIDLTVGELLVLIDANRAPQPARPHYHTLNEAGPLIGASAPMLREFIARGMPHAKIGATTKINVAQSIEWIRLHGGE